MPPYDNRMQQGMLPQAPPGMSQMGPGGQMNLGGIDPQMFQQYLRIAQQQGGGQSIPYGQQPPGMQNMSPDQGMNQAPPDLQPPPGWSNGLPPGRGGGRHYAGPAQPRPWMGDQGGGQYGGMPMQKPMMTPGGSGPFMPPGMDPGQGQLNQKPMMRPPHLGGPGMGPGGPGVQSPPIQAPPMPRQPPPPGPPPMRMPPGAGVWNNPLTGKAMNQTPIFSGANNPYDGKPDQNTPPGLAPGPASDVPGGLSSPADPIRVPTAPTSGTAPQEPGMVSSMDRPRKPQQGGSAPFNPGNPQKQAEAAGRKWQPSKTREQKKADVSTRKFTSAAVR